MNRALEIRKHLERKNWWLQVVQALAEERVTYAYLIKKYDKSFADAILVLASEIRSEAQMFVEVQFAPDYSLRIL